MCDKSLSLNSTGLKISKFNKPVSQKKIRNLENRLVWAPSEHNLLIPSGHSPWKFRTASIRITCPSTRKWKVNLIGCWSAPQRPFFKKKQILGSTRNQKQIWLALELLTMAPLSSKIFFWALLENTNYSNIITIRNCRLAVTYVFSTYQGYQDLDNDVVYHG